MYRRLINIFVYPSILFYKNKKTQGEREKEILFKRKEDNNIWLKKGFTLIEALLSMMMVAVVLTPLFVLHGVIMQRVNKSTHQLFAILWGKQLLCEAHQKQAPEAQDFTLEKKIEESQATVKYTLDKGVDAKSSLASYPGLHRELVSITWTDHQGVQRHEELVSYVYKQPEQKKT